MTFEREADGIPLSSRYDFNVVSTDSQRLELVLSPQCQSTEVNVGGAIEDALGLSRSDA